MEKMPLLVESKLGFSAIKSKMNALKTSYTKMIDWREHTGAGLLEDGKHDTVRDYIIENCNYFDALDDIYRNRRNVKATGIIDTASNSAFSTVEATPATDDALEVLGVDLQEAEITIADKNQPRKRRNVADHAPVLSIAELQRQRSENEKLIHGERLEFERQKFEWEKQQAQQAADLKMAEFQHLKEIKRMELEHEMMKAQLKIASDERIKILEMNKRQ